MKIYFYNRVNLKHKEILLDWNFKKIYKFYEQIWDQTLKSIKEFIYVVLINIIKNVSKTLCQLFRIKKLNS